MQNSKKAFTMVELVFVIVILGILAAVAIPRMAATRTDAEITKGRADISTIRSAIVTERQARLITGDPQFIAGDAMNVTGLFDGVLTYPIVASATSGHWVAVSADANTSIYDYNINGTNTRFTYTRSNGRFTCAAGVNDCDLLVN